ncbi:MAG: SLC13 family permease [Candidatus Latescibacteria bacterium]|nr:SLC13 family permease [Candidatus Latescibacterota bacterium]
MTPWKLTGLVSGLAAFALLAVLDTPLQHYGAWGARPSYAAAVTALMAIWWLTEALPIHLTACVPLILFPVTGVFGPALRTTVVESVKPYVDPYIFLFAGGMCIAAAMQRWDLHRRIALGIMRLIGTDPRRLLLGILTATACLSLWISNSATATMMVSIGIAVIAQLERQLGGKRLVHYGLAIMLGIAYAANVGGIGTKIGTATNAQFSGLMAQMGIEIPFLTFMVIGLPFVIMFLPVVWFVLWQIGKGDAPRADMGRTAIVEEMAKLGPMKPTERVVLGVFIVTAVLWILGKPITDFLQARVTAFNVTTAHVEGGIAMLAALVLLASRLDGHQVLDARAFRAVPWTTLLLLGGSFAMANGIQKSGLSEWMGTQLVGVRTLGPFWQVLLTSVATVTLSAIASNVATISVMFNLLKDAIPPPYLTTVLFTSAIAASCDFALPVGTPPNAIVFGSGYVSIPRMARTGVLLDLLAAVLAACWCWVIVRLVL